MADQDKPDLSLNTRSDWGYLRFMAEYLEECRRVEIEGKVCILMPANIAELYAAALRSIAERI